MPLEVQDLHLRILKDLLLERAVVRDLRNGAWSSLIEAGSSQTWHKRAKELLKKLKQQGRMRRKPPESPKEPVSDSDWCNEAINSHNRNPLTGIVAPKITVEAMSEKSSAVTAIQSLTAAPWWSKSKGSVRLHRKTEDYLQHLNFTLECSKHVVFIDPNIDPTKPGYRDFHHLLCAARNADIIEIHRSRFTDNKTPVSNDEWKSRFTDWFQNESELGVVQAKIEVFLWNDFHDRYLITDLLGILLPHGFDVTKDLNKPKTTWCRLDRETRDDVQGEFDRVQTPHFTFTLEAR